MFVPFAILRHPEEPAHASASRRTQSGHASRPMALTEPKPEPPHHAGHRERLRERALNGGLSALADYEALELYLFPHLPARGREAAGQAADRAVRLARRGAGRLCAGAADRGRRGRGGGAGPEAGARADPAHRPAELQQAPDHLLVERPARLCEGRPGAGGARAVPRAVPGQEEPADRRRGDEPRHGGPCPGLSARDRAPGAGAVGLGPDPGAQPPLGRSRRPPSRTST